MTKGRRAAHYAVVAAIVGASYGTGIERVSFHPDESWWIATSYYLEVFLGERTDGISSEAPRPFWAENWVVLTQPPLARYVIGAGRRLGGFGVADLNGRWNWKLDSKSNEAAGNMPNKQLLACSRRVMAALSIVSGLLLFSVAWHCAGLIGGYVFALWFAFNPYLLEALRRAMGEAALTFFVALTLVATERGVLALRAPDLDGTTSRSSPRRFVWWLVAGLGSGLAGAAKLNGLLIAGGAAIAGWIAGLFAGAELRFWTRHRAALCVAGAILIAAAIAFVATNPFLYPSPVRRTVQMWRHRFYEMELQRAEHPRSRLDGVADRARAAARRVLAGQAIVQFPYARVVNAGFTLWGFLVLARRALRSVKERQPGTELVLLLLGGTLVVPALLTPLDWDRYYLFPVLFAGLCWAAGVSIAADLLRRRLRSSPSARNPHAPRPA